MGRHENEAMVLLRNMAAASAVHANGEVAVAVAVVCRIRAVITGMVVGHDHDDDDDDDGPTIGVLITHTTWGLPYQDYSILYHSTLL